MTKPEILPCPFCGSSDVELCVTSNFSWCECQNCEAESCSKETKEEALIQWNTRAPQASEWLPIEREKDNAK